MADAASRVPSAQPAPAITETRPHRYLIRRRFIGPLPTSAVHSKEVKESRAWYRALKTKLEAENATVASTLGDASSAAQSISQPSTPALRLREDFRRKSGTGGSGWIGSSFDIGSEFQDVIGTEATPREADDDGCDDLQAAAGDPGPAMTSIRNGRPPSSRRSNTGTSTASFRTARTQHALLAEEESPSWNRDRLRGQTASSAKSTELHAPELDTTLSVQSSPAMLADNRTLRAHSEVEGGSVRRLLEGHAQGNGTSGRLRSAFKGMRANEERATSPGKPRARRRTVQFPRGDEPLPAAEPPADPLEVLARTGDQVEGTSAGVVEQSEPALDREEEEDATDYGPDSVVLRDRFLVRVGRMRGQGFKGYDESTARRPCHRVEPLREYLAAYRKGRIELYQEWKVPLKERMYGSKRLAFVIPLDPRVTSLSPFSVIDQTFSLCLNSDTFASELRAAETSRAAKKLYLRLKDSKQYQWIRKERQDTLVFVFVGREKSRLQDWYWEMSRELDWEMPTTVDVRSPDLATTVKIPVPAEDYVGSGSAVRAMSRSQVLEKTRSAIEQLPEFPDLIAQVRDKVGHDLQLHLAWNVAGRLDWITPSEDKSVENTSRPWNVVIGYAFALPRVAAHLEIRPARHRAESVRLEDGSELREPRGIEGYLHRVRQKSGVKESIYVFTYGGNVFSCAAGRAKAPLPPLAGKLEASDVHRNIYDVYLQDQQARGVANLQASLGVLDARDIEAVGSEGGGDTIEIACRQGRKIKLVAESEEAAAEWCERLNELIRYWPTKQRIDARQHADHADKTNVNDVDDSSASKPELWNWCCIDGCSPMAQSGRLYLKDTSTKQFRPYYTVLCESTLVLFSIDRSPFHRRRQQYSLLDAYVYSGFLAQAELTSVLHEDFWLGEARVYQDGLQCADDVQDCTFVLWFRRVETNRKKLKRIAGTRQAITQADKHYSPVALGRSPAKTLIFRARSKLERDQWIWAIKQDMENQGRVHKERAKRVREDGMVPE